MRISALRKTLGAIAVLALAVLLAGPGTAHGQSTQPSTGPSSAASAEAQKGTFLLTIFLRHDQAKTLDEINDHLRKAGYYQKFPPPGIEVVSWYVMMGIGQVVTLRVPAERLREVNRAIEQTAWGGFRTEFYPTYDYKPIAEAERKPQ
jgi:hypothetical protein